MSAGTCCLQKFICSVNHQRGLEVPSVHVRLWRPGTREDLAFHGLHLEVHLLL